jgi:prepilin-type N-terminal cleavage/methylation domain-containing protein
MKKPKSGFSLVELCIAMAVMLIVVAMALPAFNRTIENYRLNASANAVKDMLLQAQTAARKANEPYYANPISPMQASAQSAGGAGFSPSAATSGAVTFQGVPPGNVNINDLLNALGGIPPAAPGTPIGFNARGVPCQANPASPYVCPGPTAFIWYMQNSSGAWGAVTVSPAGRIRTWRYNTNGTWQ